MKAEEEKTVRTVRGTMGIAWGLMAGFRGRFVLAIVAMVGATAMRYLVPLVASGTIDYALGEGKSTSRVVEVFRQLVEKDWLTN
ncbi:MAG TPA: hypothetical protein VK995_03635, partial [Oceanipulchritudo sp.]|nr:hypothetical protein [Oceanipulchritudo sp.]